MRIQITIAALATALTACSGSPGFVDPPRTDDFDGGGMIWGRAVEVAEANAARSGQLRPLPRTCLSSCTMYLALKEGCLRPDSRLGLHGPNWNGTEPMTGADHELWSRVMATHYPEMVREIFWEAARLNQEITFVSGDALVAAGIVPLCPEEKAHE